MSDQHPTPHSDDRQAQQPANRTLSEISHLFLSSIREKQAGGSASGNARPQRVPPKRAEAAPAPAPVEPAVDLTPEEFAEVFGETAKEIEVPAMPVARDAHAEPTNPTAERMPPVHAMIVQHLNGHAVDRVREYAAHLCKSGERVGVITVDACEFALTSFERGTGKPSESQPVDQLDGRQMNEALEEMNWDVDRWLLHVVNPRANEARALLRQVDRWTVLATCDHDGVVSCYRTLKGLVDLHVSDGHHHVPTLSLSLLGADDEMMAMRVFRKLSGVCQQFLKWPLESEEPTHAAGSVAEHVVLSCRATRDKAQLAAAPQWNVVGEFLTRCRAAGTRSATTSCDSQPTRIHRMNDNECIPVEHQGAQTTINSTPVASRPDPAAQRPASEGTMTLVQDGFNDVIELPAGGDGSIATIVSATVRGASELVELPIKPPMLAEASLAVTRERRLVLLAVARQGLSDLRAIGEAYRWMNENRVLIAMAVPQLSIDAHQLPHLRLLVDRADLSATTLQPLLQSANVTVHTYRKLRWGPKTGLLLEAA